MVIIERNRYQPAVLYHVLMGVLLQKRAPLHRSRTSQACLCGLVCHDDSRDRWLARSSPRSTLQRFAPTWHSCAPRRRRRRCSPSSRRTRMDTASCACFPRSRTPTAWRFPSPTARSCCARPGTRDATCPPSAFSRNARPPKRDRPGRAPPAPGRCPRGRARASPASPARTRPARRTGQHQRTNTSAHRGGHGPTRATRTPTRRGRRPRPWSHDAPDARSTRGTLRRTRS